MVKRVDGKKLIAFPNWGTMYLKLKTEEKNVQKILKSAKSLKEAVERAEELNLECITQGLGCVVAEVCSPEGTYQVVNGKTKPYPRKRPFKKSTTAWKVYLAPNRQKFEIDENHNIA